LISKFSYEENNRRIKRPKKPQNVNGQKILPPNIPHGLQLAGDVGAIVGTKIGLLVGIMVGDLIGDFGAKVGALVGVFVGIVGAAPFKLYVMFRSIITFSIR
jgi:hypothetical protein